MTLITNTDRQARPLTTDHRSLFQNGSHPRLHVATNDVVRCDATTKLIWSRLRHPLISNRHRCAETPLYGVSQCSILPGVQQSVCVSVCPCAPHPPRTVANTPPLLDDHRPPKASGINGVCVRCDLQKVTHDMPRRSIHCHKAAS